LYKSENILSFNIKNLRNKEENFWHNEGLLYIHNWFYDRSEWRDLQIDVLNG